MKSILILVDSVVTIYIWVLIINALLSWLIAFNVLNTSNRLVYSLLDISYKMTDPLLVFCGLASAASILSILCLAFNIYACNSKLLQASERTLTFNRTHKQIRGFHC